MIEPFTDYNEARRNRERIEKLRAKEPPLNKYQTNGEFRYGLKHQN